MSDEIKVRELSARDQTSNVPCSLCEGQGWLPSDVHAERLDALAHSAVEDFRRDQRKWAHRAASTSNRQEEPLA